MKKTGLLLFITLTFPVFAAGPAPGEKKGLIPQWQKTMEEFKIPYIPAFFVNKTDSNLVGIGFMLNSPAGFSEDSPFRTLLRALPAFQVALLFRDKNTSSSVVLSYGQNDIWGLSARFNF
ncbi:MAG: hypothetical protein FWC45_03480 [Treponema sp.]|nr:hypothetical protein [Treponema sp.]